MYDFYEKLGKTNALHLNAMNNNSLGGPLTDVLKCGTDT